MNTTVVSTLAGGIAGSIETVVTMPFEVTKTWQQLHSSKKSVLASMREIVATNQLRGLYYGMPAMLIQTSMKVAIRFGALEQFKKLFAKVWFEPTTGQITRVGVFWAGFCAGGTEAIAWVTPWERLKILRQAQIGVGQAQERHTTLLKSIRAIIHQEGVCHGLYHGVGPTFLRNSTTMGLRFIMYDFVKAGLVDFAQGESQPWHSFVSGLIVGAIGTIINNPIDVVKSLVQSQESSGSSSASNSIRRHRFPSLQCAQSLWQEGGLPVFFQGISARLWKISLGQAVIFYSYDFIMQGLKPFTTV